MNTRQLGLICAAILVSAEPSASWSWTAKLRNLVSRGKLPASNANTEVGSSPPTLSDEVTGEKLPASYANSEVTPSSPLTDFERLLQSAGGGLTRCERLCEKPDALDGDSCLCGYCDLDCNDPNQDCYNHCSFDGAGAVPVVLTLESSDPDLTQLDLTLSGCTRTITKDGGVFHLQREGPDGACARTNAKMAPEIVVVTDAEYHAVHTSCSVPIYLGYTFGSFTVVGYCVETNPIISCSGIVDLDAIVGIDTTGLECTVPAPTANPTGQPTEYPTTSYSPTNDPTSSSVRIFMRDRMMAYCASSSWKIRMLQRCHYAVVVRKEGCIIPIH